MQTNTTTLASREPDELRPVASSRENSTDRSQSSQFHALSDLGSSTPPYLRQGVLSKNALLGESAERYARDVKNYYADFTSTYLSYLGSTFQAGLFVCDGKEDPTLSNIHIAARARIVPGSRVLDAGCGICGPSVDIASAIPNTVIDAVTNCEAQIDYARSHIRSAPIVGSVVPVLADYHDLPFTSDVFQTILFLESAGYSYDRIALFRSCFRVLKPLGEVYIKDVFASGSSLSSEQRSQLDLFNRTYLYRTRTLSETMVQLREVGFEIEYAGSVQEQVSTQRYRAAMSCHSSSTLNSFGVLQVPKYDELPVFFAEILARKP